MARNPAVARYVPEFCKKNIDKLLKLARKRIPVPYLFWHIGLSDEEWVDWETRRCEWIDAKPPLERLIKKAWAEGVVELLEKIEAKGAAFQNLAWLLERFAPHTFGRVDRVVSHATVKTDKKEVKKAAQAKKTIQKLGPADLKELRNVVYRKAA